MTQYEKQNQKQSPRAFILEALFSAFYICLLFFLLKNKYSSHNPNIDFFVTAAGFFISIITLIISIKCIFTPVYASDEDPKTSFLIIWLIYIIECSVFIILSRKGINFPKSDLMELLLTAILFICYGLIAVLINIFGKKKDLKRYDKLKEEMEQQKKENQKYYDSI